MPRRSCRNNTGTLLTCIDWREVNVKKLTYEQAIVALHILAPVMVTLISIFILFPYVPRQETTEAVIASVDQDKDTVLRLAGSSTAVSVALTALPGDFATPIAEQLAQMGDGFLVVLCALYLEKFLVTVAGTIVFKWLVPLGCVIYLVGYLFKKKALQEIAYKLGVFALALMFLVPVSTSISAMIREKYGDTIEQTIQSAEKSAGLMQESIADDGTDEEVGNGLGKVLQNLQNAGDTIAKGSSEMMRYLENLMNRFIEAIAIMVVTSCIIPILVLLVFLWIVKMIFQVDFDIHIPRNPLKRPFRR